MTCRWIRHRVASSLWFREPRPKRWRAGSRLDSGCIISLVPNCEAPNQPASAPLRDCDRHSASSQPPCRRAAFVSTTQQLTAALCSGVFRAHGGWRTSATSVPQPRAGLAWRMARRLLPTTTRTLRPRGRSSRKRRIGVFIRIRSPGARAEYTHDAVSSPIACRRLCARRLRPYARTITQPFPRKAASCSRQRCVRSAGG